MTEREQLLKDACALLKRRPKATDSMYVGSDLTPWGKQAGKLVKSIEALKPKEATAEARKPT